MHISEPYPLTINRARTLKQMIEAGRYNFVNSDITQAHFPLRFIFLAQPETLLVHFNCRISTDDGLAELDRWGYRPGDIAELLAFGEQHPEVQRQFPIVELASVWADRDGDRVAVYLCGGTAGRGLHLYWVKNVWNDFYRFLAFPK